MPDPQEPDGYLIDPTTYRNLKGVMTRLYQAGARRLTGDDIRDLANIMDANLSKAFPVKERNKD